MLDLLDVSIPAVVLVPMIAIGVLAWYCFQQTARSGDVRRAEFLRLQRLAMEEHEKAERELEQEYVRHKQVDSPGVNFRGRGAPGYGYGNDRSEIGHGEWRDPEIESRRRKQAEEEEHRKRQAEAEFNRRKQAEAEELRRKQTEIEDRKRRESEDEMRRRQTEEHGWQRRRADLEARARREAEEERRRLAAEEDKLRRWKEEEAQKQEALKVSPRRVHPVSSLSCIVCQKPTKRRCSRCKSVSYCSRECQVQHWSNGHKLECRSHDASNSPRGSVDGDARNFSDFSPRSNH